MNVSATNSTTGTTNNPQPQDLNQLKGSDFMILLTAQLKAQDPTAPQDPTQFVGQLVQFNSLQQLIDINQTLTNLSNPPKPAAVPQNANYNQQAIGQTIANSLQHLV